MQRFMGGLGRAILGLTMVAGLSLVAVQAHGAATVSMGVDSSATLSGAARYRNFGNSGSGGAAEIQVGNATLTGPSAGQLTWSTSQTFEVKLASSTLSAKVGSGAFVNFTFTSPPLSAPINYLEFHLVKNQSTTSIRLTDVELNGTTLGTGTFEFLTSSIGTRSWNVTGVDLFNAGAGFNLKGNILLSTPSGFQSGDSSYVHFAIGSVAPPDDEAPVVSDVEVDPKPVILNGDGTVTANVDDNTTGGSNIASAEYSIDGGSWTAMTAQDGTFDEVSEDVTATFTAAEVGTHEVCVRGTDAVGNTSDGSECADYLVTYNFYGFYSPVDMSTEQQMVVNLAKAGQAIPAKWRLTDYYGTPISDPASFAGLFAFLINCADLTGNVTDSVEEYASGSSGLQYMGDGYWQFNWKTPKSYAGTCRAMYVLLDSGAGSPNAFFSFK
jgi:hypothetical protein